MFERKRYPSRVTVPLEADTMAALEAVAKDAERIGRQRGP